MHNWFFATSLFRLRLCQCFKPSNYIFPNLPGLLHTISCFVFESEQRNKTFTGPRYFEYPLLVQWVLTSLLCVCDANSRIEKNLNVDKKRHSCQPLSLQEIWTIHPCCTMLCTIAECAWGSGWSRSSSSSNVGLVLVGGDGCYLTSSLSLKIPEPRLRRWGGVSSKSLRTVPAKGLFASDNLNFRRPCSLYSVLNNVFAEAEREVLDFGFLLGDRIRSSLIFSLAHHENC